MAAGSSCHEDGTMADKVAIMKRLYNVKFGTVIIIVNTVYLTPASNMVLCHEKVVYPCIQSRLSIPLSNIFLLRKCILKLFQNRN